jgi:hypothetical protein
LLGRILSSHTSFHLHLYPFRPVHHTRLPTPESTERSVCNFSISINYSLPAVSASSLCVDSAASNLSWFRK